MLRIAAFLLAGALAWAVVTAGAPAVDLGAAVREQAAARAGTAQPVTAVLLGFRAYDTLLEVTVLLLAALVAGASAPGAPAQRREPILDALVEKLVPLMVLLAGYLLWAGTRQPGGAFQAAAVLAAAGVLLRLAGDARIRLHTLAGRIALAAGPAVFLAAFLSGNLASLLLALETVLTVSIAAALLLLFASARR